MSPIARLIAQIGTNLVALAPSYAAAPGADLFEGYLLSLVAAAASAERANVQMVNATGGLLFRTGPGRIYGTTKSGSPYSYVLIDFDGRPPLEGHVGVRVEGRTRVLHECDVMVVKAAEAQACRTSRVEPRSRKLLISAEAKFYTQPLGVDLGRSFIGLITDVGSKHRCLATNVEENDVVAALMAPDKARHFFEHVMPSQPGEVSVSEFFRSAFRRYRDRW